MGCARNLVDSEQALAQLGMEGAVFTNDVREADCVIVNTCTFIREADEESREAIREAARAKREGRCKLLLIAGCMGARHGRRLLRDFPEADGVYGVLDAETVRLIAQRVLGGECGPAEAGARPRLRLTPRHYAYLRIADGCDNRCSYCVLPSVRGRLASRPMEEILSEAGHLADDGARELIIVAQDTTNYGTDLYGKRSLAELLDRLARVRGVRWLRLLYMHPAHLDETVIDRLADCDKTLAYVDLPLQHASDRILERMGRGVDSSATRRLVEHIRRRIEGVVVRTTFIVGFPGESEEDYDELEAAVREMRFERMGVFAYSPEKGTRAYHFPGQLPDEVRFARRERLLRLQREIAFEQARRMSGRRLTVVVDRVDEDGTRIARSYGEAPDVDPVIYLRGSSASPGDFVEARVIEGRGYDLVATCEDAAENDE